VQIKYHKNILTLSAKKSAHEDNLKEGRIPRGLQIKTPELKLPWGDWNSHTAKQKAERALTSMTKKANEYAFKTFIDAIKDSIEVRSICSNSEIIFT
jgi:hypothetical protein